MGSINACCEHTVNAPFSGGYKDSNFILEFVPAEVVPLVNETVKKRIQELATNPLKINTERHHKAQDLMPMKQKEKGFVYEGQWINNKPDGYGKIFFPNGEYFQGEFIDGKAAGPGRYLYQNGAYYEGNVDDNIARGKGKYISDEVTFEGTWEDSKPRVGTYQLSSGVFINVEEGHYAQIRWPDNREYSGSIGEDLNPNGSGKMIFPNKEVYEGDWRAGLMNGFGTYLWSDGRRYEGQYENGVKNGTGTYFFKGEEDGRYEGQWKKGKQDGSGKLFSKDKLVFEGTFHNGEPVRNPPPKAQTPVQKHPDVVAGELIELKPESKILTAPMRVDEEAEKWKLNPDPWNINKANTQNPWPQNYPYETTNISPANVINPS